MFLEITVTFDQYLLELLLKSPGAKSDSYFKNILQDFLYARILGVGQFFCYPKIIIKLHRLIMR